MKNHIVFTALMLAAMSISISMNAYYYGIQNQSGKKLLAQIELWSDKTPYFAIVNPGDWVHSADFNLPKANRSLNHIKCVILNEATLKLLVDNKLIHMSGNDYKVTDAQKLVKWLEQNEKYRITVVMQDNSGQAYHGNFENDGNFKIKSGGSTSLFGAWTMVKK